VPAGGTSSANYSKREIRHILALVAALGQAERLNLYLKRTAFTNHTPALG
jgi:hypothetical protein